MKLGKLVDTEIYKLCIDILAISKMGYVENIYIVALYKFINKAFPHAKKHKKSGGSQCILVNLK